MGKAKPKYELPPGRLWPNTPSGAPLAIEVFGATGDYASGKTLMGLSIAPGDHPEGHEFAGKPRTLYLDFEKSGGTYGGTGCDRIDVPSKLLATKGNSYKPIDVANWFVDVLTNKIKPGQFDVIVADPITDVESGVVEWVKANPETFGYTDNQFSKGGGILWGAVKDYWKQLLLKLSTKCQCFYFTSHLRQVWNGNNPVKGKKEPKGKDTLMELSSLYLWLERLPDKDGNVPAVPTATVMKQRLSDTLMLDNGELQVCPLMPPRIQIATAESIRGYIANPPNYSRLKQGEKVIEREMTDEEKLQYQLQIAEAERTTTENRVALMARQEELRRLSQQQTADRPQPADQSGQVKQKKLDKEKADAEQAEIDRLKAEAQAKLDAATEEGNRLAEDADSASANSRATAGHIQSKDILVKATGVTGQSFKARCGGAKFADLPYAKADAVVRWLAKMKDVVELSAKIRTAKNLSAEAWNRIVNEKVLFPAKAKFLCDLDDEHLSAFLDALRSEKAKLNTQPAEETAKN